MPRLSNAFRILVAISIEIVRAPSVSKRFTDEKDTFAALAKSRADHSSMARAPRICPRDGTANICISDALNAER